MFEYKHDVESETLPSGRTYSTPDGKFPSITTILGKTSNQVWLQAWKDKVGEEEAARISKEATDRGTLVHEYAEKFFNKENMVGEWKGIPAIIDFKTSRKKKYIRQIKDYFLQCTGYAYAHNELYNTNIKKIVIAITVENNEPQIFETNALVHVPDLKYRIAQFYKLNLEK